MEIGAAFSLDAFMYDLTVEPTHRCPPSTKFTHIAERMRHRTTLCQGIEQKWKRMEQRLRRGSRYIQMALLEP